jgi:hypothetical protein
MTVSPLLSSFEGAWGGLVPETTPNAALGYMRSELPDGRAYDGAHAVRAHYHGGGANGYARVVAGDPGWEEGDDVWYGAAFLFPEGFFAEQAQGYCDILRWDNYGAHGAGADYSGVAFSKGQDATVFVLGTYRDDPGIQLAALPRLPEGRWFWLEVHERLSARDGAALTEIYVNGGRLAASARANTFGRGPDRLRAGLVSISEGTQTKPLTMWLDRFSISTTQRGPRVPDART